MKVIFEPTDRFSDLPSNYQDAAREYLIGREFDSPVEGLRSLEEQDKYRDVKFYVGKVSLSPKQLPAIVTRVPITVLLSDNKHSPYEIDCLVAKVKN